MVGVGWWCDVVGGTVSASVGAAGVAVGRNQLVRGFVPVVGSCFPDRSTGWRGAGLGPLGSCRGGCTGALVCIRVRVGPAVSAAIGVLTGL